MDGPKVCYTSDKGVIKTRAYVKRTPSYRQEKEQQQGLPDSHNDYQQRDLQIKNQALLIILLLMC
eukprot:2069388-Amphidinium_carterae.1